MSSSQLIPHHCPDLSKSQSSSTLPLQYESTLAPNLNDNDDDDSDRNKSSAEFRSVVWEHFNKKKIDGVAKAVCKYFKETLKGDLGSGTTKKTREGTSIYKKDHPEICSYNLKNESTNIEYADTMPKIDRSDKKEFAYNFNHETTKTDHTNTTPRVGERAKHRSKKEFAYDFNHKTTEETTKTKHANTKSRVYERAKYRKKHCAMNELAMMIMEEGFDLIGEIVSSGIYLLGEIVCSDK